jgi:hypothetical protein
MGDFFVLLRVDSDKPLVTDWAAKDAELRPRRGFLGWVQEHGFVFFLHSDATSHAKARKWGEQVGPNLWKHACKSLGLPLVDYTRLETVEYQRGVP